MKNCLKILCVLLVLAIPLTACGAPAAPSSQPDAGAPASAAPPAAGGASGETYTIGLVSKDETMSWFVRMREGVERFAATSEHDIFQKGPSSQDAALQAQVIEDMIAQGVDAICVAPVDPGAIEPVCKRAMDAGIVVIAHEGSSLQNCDYDVEAFSNSQYGAFIMDNLARGMGEEGIYTTMVAAVTNASHNEWADGAIARQLEAYPNMKLLEASPRTETNGNSDTAYQKTKELIKMYPELKGIVGCTAYDSAGVARAIEELGLKDKFFVAGTGMPKDNAKVLKDGFVSSLTLWDPATAGEAMLALAIKMLDGEPIEDGLDLGIEGYTNLHFNKDNPKVLEGEGWIEINAENVDTFNF